MARARVPSAPARPTSRRALLGVFYEQFRPNTVLAGTTGATNPLAAELPLLAERAQREGRATAYVCEQYACQAPTVEPAELRQQLATR